MKILKILFKVLVVSILLVVIIITSIALYMKFYGKGILENVLSNLIGSKVRFSNLSVNLDKYAVNFGDFSIVSELGLDNDIFNAEKFIILLDEKSFKNEKKVIVKEILIKKGMLNIERGRDGSFRIVDSISIKKGTNGLAFADESPNFINLYNIMGKIKRFSIEDSTINFRDRYVPQGPFSITFSNLDVEVKARADSKTSYGIIPINCIVSFSIPGRSRQGSLLLKADALLQKEKINVAMDINMHYIDLMQFLPYFNSYTPFSFNEGIFSSTTEVAIRNNIIDSLTTLKFHKLDLVIDPGMENARFLEASVSKLEPYLMSGKGETIFDFVIKGPINKPRIGLGPKVKFAIGLVVIEELGNLIQQLQKLQK